MPREIHLNGVVQDDERPIVTIGEGEATKTYKLRPMTRDLRRKVNAVEAKIVALDDEREQGLDVDEYYDKLVDAFLDGIDVLLEIDTSGEAKHRTPASKALRGMYQQNEMGWSTIAGWFSALRDDTEAARPI